MRASLLDSRLCHYCDVHLSLRSSIVFDIRGEWKMRPDVSQAVVYQGILRSHCLAYLIVKMPCAETEP